MRLTEASLRAALVAMVVVAPPLILQAEASTLPLVTLVALTGVVLTFSEYATPNPCLVSFCAAPPVNRIRFAGLALCLVGGSLIAARMLHAPDLSGFAILTEFVLAPMSPARLLLWVLPETASLTTQVLVGGLALLSLSLAIATALAVLIALQGDDWPEPDEPFRYYANLPRSDPAMLDVERLRLLSTVYLLLGIAGPLLLSVGLALMPQIVAFLSADQPLFAVWIVVAWGMGPSFLVVRALALGALARYAEREAGVEASAG